MSHAFGLMESEVFRLHSALPVALLLRKGSAKFCMACGICLRALVRLPLLQRLDIAGHCWTLFSRLGNGLPLQVAGSVGARNSLYGLQVQKNQCLGSKLKRAA